MLREGLGSSGGHGAQGEDWGLQVGRGVVKGSMSSAGNLGGESLHKEMRLREKMGTLEEGIPARGSAGGPGICEDSDRGSPGTGTDTQKR